MTQGPDPASAEPAPFCPEGLNRCIQSSTQPDTPPRNTPKPFPLPSPSNPNPPRTHPLPPFLPTLDNPARKQEPRPNQQRRAGKGLRAIIAPTLGSRDDRTANRRAHQGRKTIRRKHHPHPHSGLPQVRRQTGQASREEGLEPARGHAVKDAPGVETALVGHGHPAEDADARYRGDGQQDVEGPETVGDVVGAQAADDADAVHRQEEVKAVGVGQVDDVAGVGGEVVEGEVEA